MTKTMDGKNAISLHRYEPLQKPASIRVIDARSGCRNADGQLECRLVDIDLDSADRPGYHCLSYTWSSPLPEFPSDTPAEVEAWNGDRYRVFLHNPEDGSRSMLLVGKNLHDFLHEFHETCPEEVQYLWADRICINHDDIEERAAQVQMMGRVYFKCEAVIAWLGPKGVKTEAALDFMKVIAQLTREEYNHRTPNTELDLVLQKRGLGTITDERLEGLGELLQRTWFERLWTYQECVLPRAGTFWCGRNRAPIDGFERTVQVLRRHISGVVDAQRLVTPTTPRRHDCNDTTGRQMFSNAWWKRVLAIETNRGYKALRHSKRSEFPTVMFHSTDKCANPRDRVYGFLGLVDGHLVDVDYTKSIEEVFVDAALAVDEYLLYYVGDETMRITENLPSWVPDIQVPCDPFPWHTRGGYQVYSAGGGRDGGLHKLETADRRILAVLGLQVDHVATCSATYAEMVEGDGLIQALRVVDQLGASNNNLTEIFWRTLVANLTGNSPTPPSSEIWGRSFRHLVLYQFAREVLRSEDSAAVKRLLESLVGKPHGKGTEFLPRWSEVLELVGALRGDDGSNSSIVGSVVEAAKPYLDSLKSMFEKRRFFITANGRMAIGPQTVRAGDRVFLLKESGYPFLLRPSGNARYKVVGACYVNGIMYGEALNGVEWQRVEME